MVMVGHALRLARAATRGQRGALSPAAAFGAAAARSQCRWQATGEREFAAAAPTQYRLAGARPRRR
jgi:hypothetical protein